MKLKIDKSLIDSFSFTSAYSINSPDRLEIVILVLVCCTFFGTRVSTLTLR